MRPLHLVVLLTVVAVMRRRWLPGAAALWLLGVGTAAAAQPQAATPTAAPVVIRPYEQGGVVTAALSPGGEMVAVLASEPGVPRIHLFDLRSGALLRKLGPAWSAFGQRTMVFSPGGTLLAAGMPDWTVRVWEVRTGRLVAVLRHPPSEPGEVRDLGIRSIAFDPSGLRLVSADFLGRVRLWELRTGRALWERMSGEDGFGVDVGFTRGGRRVLAAHHGLAEELSTATGRRVRAFPLGLGSGRVLRESGTRATYNTVLDFSSSADGRVLAVHGMVIERHAGNPSTNRSEHWIRILRPGREPVQFPVSGSIGEVRVSPDGRRVGTAGSGNRVWDTSTGREVFTIPGQFQADTRAGDPLAIDFTPDGGTLITVHHQPAPIFLWRLPAAPLEGT